jgi:hypothetical protein
MGFGAGQRRVQIPPGLFELPPLQRQITLHCLRPGLPIRVPRGSGLFRHLPQ